MCPIDDEESGPAGGRERGNNARSLLLPAPVDYEPWNVETLIPRKQHSMQPDGQMMHIVDSDPNYESVINLQPSIHIPRFNCEGDCKSFLLLLLFLHILLLLLRREINGGVSLHF